MSSFPDGAVNFAAAPHHGLGSSNGHDMQRKSEQGDLVAHVSQLLEYSRRVPSIRSMLDAVFLPEANGTSLTSILESAASSGGDDIATRPGVGKAMEIILATLAEQNSNANARARKRARDEYEAQEQTQTSRNDIGDIIHAALKVLQNNIVDPGLLTTLQLRLHAIFISSVSYLTPFTPVSVRDTLSKMSKLVQLIGVLSGLQLPVIPILTMLPNHLVAGSEAIPALSSNPTPPTHPCPHPTCLKTFQKAYDLRVHSRVHKNCRPFACPSCPATFTRSHDLQRHTRSHPRPSPNANPYAGSHHAEEVVESVAPTVLLVVVRCTVCKRTFSRRDAFLRHIRGGRGKQSESHLQCAAALGETVLDVPSPSSTRKRASRWEKPQVGHLWHAQNTKSGQSQTMAVEMPDQATSSDPNDPFSIFSEMDLAQMGIDLNQLLSLPQFAEHIPDVEL